MSSRWDSEARRRLSCEALISVADAATRGIELVPHKPDEWEVQAEKERILEELLDIVLEARVALSEDEHPSSRAAKALFILEKGAVYDE